MIKIVLMLNGNRNELTLPQAKVAYQELRLIFEPAEEPAIYPERDNILQYQTPISETGS